MKSVNNIYYFDTNILIGFRNAYPKAFFPSLWDKLDDLFKIGKAVSHKTVYDEICHSKTSLDEIGLWFRDKEQYCIEISQNQINELTEIMKTFPKLIDPNSTKEQADPWIIASLIEINKNTQLSLFPDSKQYILVTDESPRSPHKLPAACAEYGIKSINRFEFFELENWSFIVS